jgi:GABA(A) receptor-associated protein
MKHNSSFKLKNNVEKRSMESNRIMTKYKDRVPIIIEVTESDKELILDKTKYLVPMDLSVAQFIHIIRKRIKLHDTKALFLFFNNTLPPSSDTLSCVYKKYKDVDGFLYGILTLENVFG